MYFTTRNKSSEEFGIKIYNCNHLSSPERDIDVYEIDGREGPLIIDNNKFKAFELKFECEIKSWLVGKTLEQVSKEMKEWLQTDFSYSELVISDTSEYYYEATCINELDIEYVAKNFGVILLKFLCKPCKKKNNEVIILKESGVINNNGRTSKPIIKVVGNGDITININTQNVVLKDIQNYIILDSEQMNAYTQNDVTSAITNQNNKMFSDFPVLDKGENRINWTGTVSSLEIYSSEVIL